ncbi:hypothetical protein ACIBTV_25555 [Micromonospora sp. NPDC049366]|uniref:hypothetical protein n=1 Tax=Micromonospora sp. NPDC049366 TaxID=3364271 RepID=UPI0037B35BEA
MTSGEQHAIGLLERTGALGYDTSDPGAWTLHLEGQVVRRNLRIDPTDLDAATAWARRALRDFPVPFDPGTGPVPGYIAGLCGHRVARTEWAAGFRVCERCPSLKADVVEASTMEVRVVDRGTQVGYEYPLIRTVRIATTCPQCGGRRGEPSPFRFCEDGGWLVCDRWTNPCGHIDYYGQVLREVGLRA